MIKICRIHHLASQKITGTTSSSKLLIIFTNFIDSIIQEDQGHLYKIVTCVVNGGSFVKIGDKVDLPFIQRQRRIQKNIKSWSITTAFEYAQSEHSLAEFIHSLSTSFQN